MALANIVLVGMVVFTDAKANSEEGLHSDSYSTATYLLGCLGYLGTIGEQYLKSFNIESLIKALEDRRDHLWQLPDVAVNRGQDVEVNIGEEKEAGANNVERAGPPI